MSIQITGATLTGSTIESLQSIYTNNLQLQLDASTYIGSGDWIDSIGSKSFTLYGSPTYNAVIGGGSFDFDPASSQYASCSTSLASMTNWTVEVWHYYAGTNSGSSPCIITEYWPNSTGNLNYTLGSIADNSPNLSSAFFNGAWRATPSGYTLTSGNWYQIVGTYDGSTIKLYINNTLTQSASYTGISASGTQGIRLMRRWDVAQYWGGKLGIVRIYNTDIGSVGITQNWNTNKTRFGL